MSDTMFYGVLRMPYTMAMSDDMSRIQFYDRAQEAADRVEAADKRIAELEDMVCKLAVAAPVAQPEIWCGCGDQIMPDDGARCGTCVAIKYAPVAQQEPDTGTYSCPQCGAKSRLLPIPCARCGHRDGLFTAEAQ